MQGQEETPKTLEERVALLEKIVDDRMGEIINKEDELEKLINQSITGIEMATKIQQEVLQRDITSLRVGLIILLIVQILTIVYLVQMGG